MTRLFACLVEIMDGVTLASFESISKSIIFVYAVYWLSYVNEGGLNSTNHPSCVISSESVKIGYDVSVVNPCGRLASMYQNLALFNLRSIDGALAIPFL